MSCPFRGESCEHDEMSCYVRFRGDSHCIWKVLQRNQDVGPLERMSMIESIMLRSPNDPSSQRNRMIELFDYLPNRCWETPRQ